MFFNAFKDLQKSATVPPKSKLLHERLFNRFINKENIFINEDKNLTPEKYHRNLSW